MNNIDHIRNFCVISHIDHGKTTLTDRFLELTHTVAKKDFQERLLDSNPIERERGITIKLAPVRMTYSLEDRNYILNLIDTPGHVDFSYEVSRSLAAGEGAVLLVDATQGIQAQTVANAYQAFKNNLTIIPVINKIDMANAEPAKAAQELQDTFAFTAKEIVFISAKTGQNLVQLIKAIIHRLPPPSGSPKKPLRALLFNSFYHPHKGVVAYVRIIDGQIHPQDQLFLLGSKTPFTVKEIGFFAPQLQSSQVLLAGEVGFLATGLKDISLCRVGDTITFDPQSCPSGKAGFVVRPLAGYQEPKPMVFMDFYPLDNQDFPALKSSLNKLQLMDSSLSFKSVTSPLLGSGFKVGFQGALHADIVQERLLREFNVQLIATSPSIEYQLELKKNQQTISIISPSDLPDPTLINQIKEPFVLVSIFTPKDYLGQVLTLCQSHRGELKRQQYFGRQVRLEYHLPLAELVSGFFNRLKSVSSGFASLDWQFLEFRPADIVKLTVLLNRQPIEPLSKLVIRSQAPQLAKRLAQKLKTLIPRQQFEVPIQVALGGKILARETVKAFRKDVTAKLYGGDQTRKDKLLKKQKKGKKRLKQIGRLKLPQEVFLHLSS
jgi:GTP-binding protein LepA